MSVDQIAPTGSPLQRAAHLVLGWNGRASLAQTNAMKAGLMAGGAYFVVSTVRSIGKAGFWKGLWKKAGASVLAAGLGAALVTATSWKATEIWVQARRTPTRVAYRNGVSFEHELKFTQEPRRVAEFEQALHDRRFHQEVFSAAQCGSVRDCLQNDQLKHKPLADHTVLRLEGTQDWQFHPKNPNDVGLTFIRNGGNTYIQLKKATNQPGPVTAEILAGNEKDGKDFTFAVTLA